MPFIAHHPEKYAGRIVGDGSSAAYVELAAGVPLPGAWRKGLEVENNGLHIARGSAIATMFGAGYGEAHNGVHSAIFVSEDFFGLVIWDQCVGQPVSCRRIPRNSHLFNASNYFVIET